ncbi:hypothetical protein [Photobacterium lipolyticum]|uniref:Uncharacterized protein n=1 Tax=Photobacterium lipolyticum TaxID=266810 RepID=A0A2T3MTC5_9GAMM|nr:hypothetical protein [Photobacterium lipolyticum]PSW02557.1 hypothetical protein C9I89_18735 [Photobacterium lipolyticum]
MFIDEHEKQPIRQLLKSNGCNREQIKEALDVLGAKLQSHPTPEKGKANEYIRETEYLDDIPKAVKILSRALTRSDPAIRFELACSLRENLLSQLTSLDNPVDAKFWEEYAGEVIDKLPLILNLIGIESSFLKTKLHDKKKSEDLLDTLANLWVQYADTYDFTPTKADAITFCCIILDADEDVIKKRFDALNIKIEGKKHRECKSLIINLRAKFRSLPECEKKSVIERIHNQTTLTEVKIIGVTTWKDIKYPRDLTKFKRQLTEAIITIDEVLASKQSGIKINYQPT